LEIWLQEHQIDLADRIHGGEAADFWNSNRPEEYDFVADVRPDIPHPRWSQATEKSIDTGERHATLPYNGYGEWVAHLYR